MSDDPLAYFRRKHRRDYLRDHAQERRNADRQARARRIDVTLDGRALDDFAEVRGWLEEQNEHISRINAQSRSNPRRFAIPPSRLSAPEVIKAALSIAAAKIAEDRAKKDR
jgi:hypothetical protein